MTAHKSFMGLRSGALPGHSKAFNLDLSKNFCFIGTEPDLVENTISFIICILDS